MKKLCCLILALTLVLAVGCSAPREPSASSQSAPTATNADKLVEMADYVYEVSEYRKLDYKGADAYFAAHNDNWGGGCSAISKMVDGHRLIGRNMDLNISNKCAYIVRTDAGKYKTIGLAYTFRDYSPDYDKVKTGGISDEFYNLLPFLCDDVLNDAGLHVEVNMRHGEYWPNGDDKFACKGTNPKSKQRVYMFELPRYIGEHCATVEEAKKYVDTLDVYSENHYWNYCFVVSDSKGKSSLLEFAGNEVFWFDEDKLAEYDWLKAYNMKAIGQTNFFLNEYAWYAQDIKSGEGRFITLQNGIDAVNSRSDMYDLMRKVEYSSFYLDYDECKNEHFDPRSENLGEFSWAVYDVLMHPDFEDKAREMLNEYTSGIRDLSRKQKQEANQYWESTFTEVVDTETKEIFVRMFEKEDLLFLIGFNGTKRLGSISDWK